MNFAEKHPQLTQKSLKINGDCGVGNTENRYLQHGFHFTADNCIACHSCEAACSEKNDLPPHLAFRKVGSIEGGSYPNTVRMNISMACNHCDDPVCLKGCPTRAYTKYAEYGAVLQDPEICFGCGYCTWVCPYNAPVLDPVRGEVSKCNMCVDLLEVGLKPACVTSCLGNALEFGVIEDLPKNREQAVLDLPGFPDPSISRPNIRFQRIHAKSVDFQRIDSELIHYPQNKNKDSHHTEVTKNKESPRWGWKQLSSHENPLVFFTLLSQCAVGGVGLLVLLPFFFNSGNLLSFQKNPWATAFSLGFLIAAQSLGLLLSTLHLGKPHRFYRAFNNLRYSWLSREALSVGIFFKLLMLYTLLTVFPALRPSLNDWNVPILLQISVYLDESLLSLLKSLVGGGAVFIGSFAVFAMNQTYRIKARPFWNHGHTLASFLSSALMLGSVFLGLFFRITEMQSGFGNSNAEEVFQLLALPLLLACGIQWVSGKKHRRYLKECGAEAAVSLQKMEVDFGKLDKARTVILALLTLISLFFMFLGMEGLSGFLLWMVLLPLAVFHEVTGRALFYVCVVPTSMPGGFFFGNKKFEEEGFSFS